MQGMGNSFRYLCAKNYEHKTWIDKVIEKIKRVQFFCPTGYNLKKQEQIFIVFGTLCAEVLASKCVHDFSPHLSYDLTLPGNTTKTKYTHCIPS